MKFKTLEINDVVARQIVMCEDSEKEMVLYAEQFTPTANHNNEFVIGLSLAVREWNQSRVVQLASEIRTRFKKYYDGDDFAVAIHNKKLDDEVHFHISYNSEPLDGELIKAEFSQLEI